MRFPEMNLRRGAGLIGALLIVLSGCSPKTTQPTPVYSPVTDSAPYWCSLVPKSSLTDITWVTGKLTKFSQGGEFDPAGGLCFVSSVHSRYAAMLDVDVARGSAAIDSWNHEVGHVMDGRYPLPANMGAGGALVEIGPTGREETISSDSYVLFECGNDDVWLRLSISGARTKRNLRKDMMDLVLIAKARYGKISGCEPRNVPPPPTPTP